MTDQQKRCTSCKGSGVVTVYGRTRGGHETQWSDRCLNCRGTGIAR